MIKLRDIKCLIQGHDYFTLQVFTPEVERVVCKRCKRDYLVHNANRQIIKWDKDAEDMYTLLGFTIRPNPYRDQKESK